MGGSNKYFYCPYFSCSEKYFKVRIFKKNFKTHFMSIVQKPSEFFEHLQKEHGHTDTPENLIKIVQEQEKVYLTIYFTGCPACTVDPLRCIMMLLQYDLLELE